MSTHDHSEVLRAVRPPSAMAGVPVNYVVWKAAAWFGPAFIVGLLLFWGIVAGFVPPPRQDWTADETVKFFTDNNLGIRVGMVGTAVFAGFYFVWSAVISRIIQRIEGPDGILSYIELMGGVTTTVVTFMLAVVWLTAAFRMGARSAQDVQTLYDLGWFIFNNTFIVTFLQMVAFGIAMLIDKRRTPLFPAWLAWLGFAAALSFLAVLLVPFVMDGPFAWHGLVSYWIALTAYFLWAVLACFYVLRAVDTLRLEATAGT